MPTSISGLSVCRDARCQGVIAAEDEICYECGGTDFVEVRPGQAALLGELHDREIAFVLGPDGESTIGRSDAGVGGPAVDLWRFPASYSVHHRHATLQAGAGGWQLTHAGRNALVIRRGEQVIALDPGASVDLESGDTLLVGLVALRFVAP